MFEDQIESSTEETEGGESGSQEPSEPYVEPRPEDYGVTLGTNPCIDKCWQDFLDCKNTPGKSATECLASWQYCIQNCPPVADAGAGGESPDAGETPTE